MPPPKYMPPSYLGGMDRHNYFDFTALDQFSPTYAPNNVESEGIKTNLGVKQLGTTLNPFQNQLQALQARIREGASKVEFEFMGRGKGNSQQTTPETYGKEEREIMRKLAHINDIRSSTHATPSASGLAGFGQNGFSRAQQQANVEEVTRAIDFAKDATTGGAIVVHTGEWQRPVEPYYGDSSDDAASFSLYTQEDKDAPFLVVDDETGQVVQGINKRREISVPKFVTAREYKEEFGKEAIGKPKIDVEGNEFEGQTIQPDDYVDVYGRYIDPNKIDQMFQRVPIYNKKEAKFETEEIDWQELQRRADERNQGVPEDKKITPEEIYAELEVDNNILQSRGQSIFNQRGYLENRKQLNSLVDAKRYYEQLDDSLDEEEKYQIMSQTRQTRLPENIIPNKNTPFLEQIQEEIDRIELELRYSHQASAAADAQAARLRRQRDNLKSVEKFGLERTGEALSELAFQAMAATKQAKQMRKGTNEKFDDLYIAPENWNPKEYGSHPEELLKIVKAGRKKFKEQLKLKKVTNDEKELDRLAKAHIKSTFDIGHLNMWRNMMEKKDYDEPEEQFQERFNKWVFKYLDELHEEEALGHIHLTDNLGINDEHLTIGQGNAPVKEFVKWLEEKGYDDFIIEPGSFNATTIMPDAWSYLGATNWKSSHVGSSPRFRQTHNAAAGFYAPPMYMVGAYVPSNEFTLWSGVQLE